jgi:hypothetical protein
MESLSPSTAIEIQSTSHRQPFSPRRWRQFQDLHLLKRIVLPHVVRSEMRVKFKELVRGMPLPTRAHPPASQPLKDSLGLQAKSRRAIYIPDDVGTFWAVGRNCWVAEGLEILDDHETKSIERVDEEVS